MVTSPGTFRRWEDIVSRKNVPAERLKAIRILRNF